MLFITHLRRAFNSNLQTISATSGECTRLESAGIREPVLQRYFTWRRSLLWVVVIATLLNAGLVTFRDLTEDDTSSLFDVIHEKLAQGTTSVLQLPVSQIPTSAEIVSAADEILEDNRSSDLSLEASEQDAEGDDEQEEEHEPQTAFGQFADGVHLVALYAMPISALAVILLWTRLTLTFRVLQIGFAFAFFVPMLLALCPWSWWGYVEPDIQADGDPISHYTSLMEGMVEGAVYLITLLPTVLSLIPGVQRASLRVKTLLPQSLLPGWFLVSASPFYALFLLVIFVAVNQVASDPIFLGGMFLFLAAPLIYVARADLFTAPLLTNDAYLRMRRVQRIVGLVTVAGALLLVVYLTTQRVLDMRLVGLDPNTSLLRPLDLVEFALEIIGRSMFMTVLGADVFMRMNLTTWQHQRELAGSPAADHYDRTMGALVPAAS